MFLADGTAEGIVLAEMGNWVGKVMSAPRPRVRELLKRPECARSGIYIMLGPDPDRPGDVMAYIGEADNVAARMRYHVSSGDQDFFERVAVVVSSDDNLTKTHARYLESQLIRVTRSAGSVHLANTREPDFRRLPEADRSEMDTFLIQLRIVLPLLGYDLFRKGAQTGDGSRDQRSAPRAAPAPSSGTTYRFEPVGASATAIETDDGFMVLAGSTARLGESGTFPAGYRALRDRLIADGALAIEAEAYRFVRGVGFSSPSAAAAIVAGRSASGPGEWRTEAGLSYREIKSKELAPAA
jgi:hypothetical protein